MTNTTVATVPARAEVTLSSLSNVERAAVRGVVAAAASVERKRGVLATHVVESIATLAKGDTVDASTAAPVKRLLILATEESNARETAKYEKAVHAAREAGATETEINEIPTPALVNVGSLNTYTQNVYAHLKATGRTADSLTSADRGYTQPVAKGKRPGAVEAATTPAEVTDGTEESEGTEEESAPEEFDAAKVAKTFLLGLVAKFGQDEAEAIVRHMHAAL